MNTRSITVTLLVFLIVISGCNPYKQDNYKQQYVVESYLVEGTTLPPLALSTTTPVDQKYSISDAGVGNADVQIQLLDDAGNVQKRYDYFMYAKGLYLPKNNTDTVKSLRKYHLRVVIPDSRDTLEATAIVPKAFHFINNPPDSVIYQSGDGISLDMTQSYYPGRQTEYIASAVAEGELDSLRLTPFYSDVYSRSNDNQLSDYQINNSNIINEGNFTVKSDGTINIQYPWIGIAYYGENSLVINAIDDNVYDFVRSQSVQTGGNTLPPGQIQNAIMHVKGGIGVFGAMATDTVRVYIKRNPNL